MANALEESAMRKANAEMLKKAISHLKENPGKGFTITNLTVVIGEPFVTSRLHYLRDNLNAIIDSNIGFAIQNGMYIYLGE